MVLTLRRGWLTVFGLAAGIGFAGLVFWASSPLDIPAQAQDASASPVLSAVSTQAHEVALTFDDGPDPRNTPAVLDLLEKYHAKATFFVLGVEVQRYPGLLQAIANDGEEIGSHAMSHASLPSLKPARIAYELTTTADLVRELTGSQPLFFRPPYGNLSPLVLSTAQRLHETVTLWTIDTRDWTGRSTAAIVYDVLSHLRPGAIILMHDGGGPRPRTIRALQLILQGLDQRGYRAVTLQKLVHDATTTAASAGAP